MSTIIALFMNRLGEHVACMMFAGSGRRKHALVNNGDSTMAECFESSDTAASPVLERPVRADTR